MVKFTHNPFPLARGFTLVEMLVALAVVAILATVALPAYQQQVRKGRRADAVDAANAVLQAQERWRANNPAYTDKLVDDLKLQTTSARGYYTVAVTAPGASGYTLRLSAVAGKGQDKDTGCETLTLNVTGGSAKPDAASAKCWSQ